MKVFPRLMNKFLLRTNVAMNLSKFSTKAQEQQIQIENSTINYVKVGSGSKNVLCFPGALGTIWSSFQPQLEGLNKDLFTMVSFDPPGYGYSRPPDRKFTVDFYEKDAIVAHQLMKKLGLPKFSLLGWSDGGISSIILAAKYPECIEKLIVWGANSYLVPEDLDGFERIRDTKNWSEKAKQPLIALYGANTLQQMWNGWCDAQIAIHKSNHGNICMDSVAKIRCPTLILHGAKDPVVLADHPKYLNANIRNSKLYIFPDGKHNIHLRYADDFNKLVTEFITEQEQLPKSSM